MGDVGADEIRQFLEQVVQNALPHANAFDLSVNELREHLATTYQMLGLHS